MARITIQVLLYGQLQQVEFRLDRLLGQRRPEPARKAIGHPLSELGGKVIQLLGPRIVVV